MALDLDGMAVLRSIASNPKVFANVEAEAAKYARTLVTKQLKAKGSGLPTLQAVKGALGRESFTLIVDGMTDSEVKTLVGRLDKYHPKLKASNAAWRRTHLRDLADGKVEPTPKPSKPKAAPKPKARSRPKSPAREFLDLQSMRVTRKR